MIFIWSRQFPVQRWPPYVNIINGCGRYVVLIEVWLFYAKDFPRMRLKWFCQGKRGGIVDVYLTIRVTNNNLFDFKDYIFYNVFNLENKLITYSLYWQTMKHLMKMMMILMPCFLLEFLWNNKVIIISDQ